VSIKVHNNRYHHITVLIIVTVLSNLLYTISLKFAEKMLSHMLQQ